MSVAVNHQRDAAAAVSVMAIVTARKVVLAMAMTTGVEGMMLRRAVGRKSVAASPKREAVDAPRSVTDRLID